MFENLKAFIRHGKQANEIKRRGNLDSELSGQTYTSSGMDEVIPSYSGLDSTLASKRQHVGKEPLQVDHGDFHGEYHGDFQDIQGLNQGFDHDLQIEPPAHEHTPQSNQNQTQNTQDYSHAASHIVEQERIQRQRSVTYPNLDNYEVMEKMGEGAFSIVYKARHLPSQQFVAIKILRKFQMDQAQKQAVMKEVTIMRQLAHPNVVSFIEFIDLDQYYYIVQELAVGGEIFTAIVDYTYFSEDLSRHVIRQVAEAIRYLHEEVGIVHRDIKPENLLYMPIDFSPLANPLSKLRKSDDPNQKKDEGEFVPGVGGGTIGVVKLADFGLSKQIWEHNTKTPCGTVGYTAPEIVRDERYLKEVDMWAIGCVLYTLLCGFPPFYDERIETLTEKVAKGEYTFLNPWWDEISAEAKYCVSKLLTVDPRRRYTIDEFLQDPWMQQRQAKPAFSVPARNSAAQAPRYSKKFKNDLYSPAAVALRDAFDISTAVHRMGEEAALANRGHMTAGQIPDLLEEEEEEDVDRQGHVLQTHPPKQHQIPPQNLFDLNLGGASILERRKNKPVFT